MFRWVKRFEHQSRAFLIAATLPTVVAVGLVDYANSQEISFSVFYSLALGMATWFVGRRFAYFISVFSVAVSLAGDLSRGSHYSGPLVPFWYASIVLAFYLVVVGLLTRLRSRYTELKARVQQRTAALTDEMAER